MKLNKIFSVILCAVLFSSNIGFAAEGWRGYIPSAADAREAASRAYNAMPDVRGAASRAYNAAADVPGRLYNAMPDVRGRAQNMLQNMPSADWLRNFVIQNKNAVIGTLLAIIPVGTLISHLNGYYNFRKRVMATEAYKKLNPTEALAEEMISYETYLKKRGRHYFPEYLGGKPKETTSN